MGAGDHEQAADVASHLWRERGMAGTSKLNWPRNGVLRRMFGRMVVAGSVEGSSGPPRRRHRRSASIHSSESKMPLIGVHDLQHRLTVR